MPSFIVKWRVKKAEILRHSRYKNLPTDEIFNEIYENNDWGDEGEYHSGSGSHNTDIIKPYIDALVSYFKSLEVKPVIVDIGSGDFNIGRNFPDLVEYYYACDIVLHLQEYNKTRFSFGNVEFLCIDATNDDIPDGDIVIIRQVLQHLSNSCIKKIIQKCKKFDKLIITEHVPFSNDFIPNKDISTGCGIRTLYNSGVVLTKGPFNLGGYNERILCESFENNGIIRTIFFEKNKIL